MTSPVAIGRVGGASGNGSGKLFRAQVLEIEKTNSVFRYRIQLIDPPPGLAGTEKCFLVGKHPDLQNGATIMVIHHQRNQFLFKALAESVSPSNPAASPNIGGADTQPGLASNLAQLTEAPTLSGLGAAHQAIDQIYHDNGMFVRFNPGDVGRILRYGELLLLPDHYILPGENPQHEDRLDFVRLNHTIAYKDGRGIQLCCSAEYYRMMEKVLKYLRSEVVFSADMKRAIAAPEYALRNPGLKKLDPTQVDVYQVFPQEIIDDYGYHLPAVFAQFKNKALPNTLYFKLLLEKENPVTQKTAVFSPYGCGVIDLVHDLMFYDFRAIIVKKE